jgi:nanoRNase/pAp phosphatase (c-di-AMP/oligoRNAs hydrolase)
MKRETELNLAKLMEMVLPNESLLLLLYGSPDSDSIASAIALRELLIRTCGLAKSIIVSTDLLSR